MESHMNLAKYWIKALTLFALLVFTQAAFAANKTFTGPGNFSNPALWSGGTLPVAGDNLRINGSCVYDVTTNIAYGYLRVGRNSAGTLTWPAGSTAVLQAKYVYSSVAGSSINMSNGGVLQINTAAALGKTPWVTTNMTFVPGTGTVVWNVNYAQNLPAAIPAYNNLTVSSTGTIATSLGAATTVTGNLLIASGALNASAFALNVKGNFTNVSTFNAGTGTVTMNGTAAQTVTGTNVFNNLTLSNATGITISGSTTVNGVFTPGTTPITVNAGSTLKIGATTYTGPCSGVYGAGYCAPVTVANFDCVETGVAYTPNPVSPARNPLYTKLAGTPFSFDVVALKANGTVETTYAKSVTVALVDTSAGGTCATYPALAPAVSQTLAFAVANSGRKTSANMTVGKSYKSLACRVTDATVTPNIVGCSADRFSVRPVSLALTATGLNADATGASVSATPAVKAGANFTLTATASDTGYTGTPTLDAAALVAHSGAVSAGTLTGTFAAATAGVSSNTFTYSEAGYFKLNANGLLDSSYAAIDSAAGDCTNDFSITLTGGKYGCKVGSAASTYFGRFIPDHFAITAGAVTTGNNSFTYFGHDGFTTAFTLTAQNAANATTQNYSGSFARFALTTWSNFGFSAGGLPAGATLTASATAPSGIWSSGAASVAAKHQVNRPANPAVITNITVSALPVDADGVTLPVATAVSTSTTPLYFGQIKLANNLGSELKPLPISATVQHCNAVSGVNCTEWRTNTADTQTALITPYLVSSNPNPAGLVVSVGTPSAISKGQININITNTAKLRGNIDLTPQSPAWLPSSGTARATFGVYSGKKDIIYMRESY